jgi:hypothetical protein
LVTTFLQAFNNGPDDRFDISKVDKKLALAILFPSLYFSLFNRSQNNSNKEQKTQDQIEMINLE